MRSKTSFFNRGLCLNFLKRYWPLWTSWLAILLLSLPGQIPNLMTGRNADMIAQRINRHLLQSGVDTATFSFFAAVAVVMAVYSYLYNSRSCSMVNSLPIRRESVFFTAFFTGLVPLLLAELISAGVTALMVSGIEGVDAGLLWSYLGCAMLSTVAFYGMAVFCAMLTGNILVLPAIYVLLNVAAVLAESAVRGTLYHFVYGFTANSPKLLPASPIAWLVENLNVSSSAVSYTSTADGPMAIIDSFPAVYRIEGLWMLAIYAAVGLVLVALALLLYRRRDMECVGDVVAIAVLKPIFKYSLTLGVSFCFTAVFFELLFDDITYSLTEAVAVLVLLLVGAFIGYFAAEMLLQKTLRVFGRKWKGFIITAAALIAFVLLWESDALGFESYVPDVEKLERVSIVYAGETELSQSENLALMTDYHRQLIEAKAENESAELTETVSFCYTLKNGRSVSRIYRIADSRSQHENPRSNIMALASLLNVQEAIDDRAATDLPVTEESVAYAYFHVYRVDEQGETISQDMDLSEAELAEFYNRCLLPDSREGLMCRIWPVRNEQYYNTVSNVSLTFSLLDIDGVLSEDTQRHYFYDFTVYMDAARCVEWIEEHTQLELMPLALATPDEMAHDLENYGITR